MNPCPVCNSPMYVIGTSMNGEYRFCGHCARTDYVPYAGQQAVAAMEGEGVPATKLDLDAIKALVVQLDRKDQQQLYEFLYNACDCRMGR